ncbi:MFS transporter [Clostridium hydrogenum]|uniref:MFS transporter n=1 Tax=Clostridium hydrogenum TaxID=2855764 RepID=UPI001F285D40|nr:MFS transporter [Clostridium hydrogenum]
MKTLKFNNELKNFYILQLGQFISQFGSKMTSFGLILWAYEHSGSVLSISALTVCTLIPSVLLSFFAGSFIDGWNKKKIMLIANLIATFFSVITLCLILLNRLDIVYLYIINFVLGMVDAFEDPASNVIISLIVPKDYYTKISGIRSFVAAFNTTFSPILCTAFYALLGLNLIIFFDLCSFIFAFICLLFFVHVPNDKLKKQLNKDKFLSNCKQGFVYLKNKKGILHLILFMSFVNLIASIESCNLTPMILSRNGNNKYELGMVSSMVGIAGIIGSIIVTIMKEPKKRVPIIINSMILSFLLCDIPLGMGHKYYTWMLAIFLGYFLVPFLTANVEYLMRTKIPLEMQGRVFAARNALQYSSIPIGYILGGILTDKIFKPFMDKPSSIQNFFTHIVGNAKGDSNGLVFILIGIVGFIGCYLFKFDSHLKSLDDKVYGAK